MNTLIKYCSLIVAALTLLFTGCKQREITEEMSDSVKLELLDINLEKSPDNPHLLAARAKVLFNLQRLNEASYDISRALAIEPEELDYLLLQADIFFAGGNLEDSYKTLETAERLFPRNKEVQLKMGEITFYSRDYDRSLKYLSDVTAHDPNNRTALFMKGFIYKEKGDTANAVQFFRRVCDRFPDYAPAFEELGVLYAARGENLALEYLNTALQLEPSNTNVMYALALFYQDRGEMENAETLYRQIIDINPASADAWHNLGWIELTHYNDYQRAVEYFDKAVESDPEHQQAHANRQLAVDAMK